MCASVCVCGTAGRPALASPPVMAAGASGQHMEALLCNCGLSSSPTLTLAAPVPGVCPVPFCSGFSSEPPGQRTRPWSCREAVPLVPGTGEGTRLPGPCGCWALASLGRVVGLTGSCVSGEAEPSSRARELWHSPHFPVAPSAPHVAASPRGCASEAESSRHHDRGTCARGVLSDPGRGDATSSASVSPGGGPRSRLGPVGVDVVGSGSQSCRLLAPWGLPSSGLCPSTQDRTPREVLPEARGRERAWVQAQASDVQVESGRTAEAARRVPEGSACGSAPTHAWPPRRAWKPVAGVGAGWKGAEAQQRGAGGTGRGAGRPGEVLQPLEDRVGLMKGAVPGWHRAGSQLGGSLRGHPRQPEPGSSGALVKNCAVPSPAGWPGLSSRPDTLCSDHRRGDVSRFPRVLPGARGSRRKRGLGTSLTGCSMAGRWPCSYGLCQLVLCLCCLAHRPPPHGSRCPRCGGPTQGGGPEGQPVCSQRPLRGLQIPTATQASSPCAASWPSLAGGLPAPKRTRQAHCPGPGASWQVT